MTILETVYASRPTDQQLVLTLEIRVSDTESVWVCSDMFAQQFYVDGVLRTFEPGPLAVNLPASNTNGAQSLSFGVWAGDGRAQRYVDAALESGQPVKLVYREYLQSDRTQPARRPVTMTVRGGEFEADTVVFEAGYHDILNTAWPRERYTAETAPGLKYFT